MDAKHLDENGKKFTHLSDFCSLVKPDNHIVELTGQQTFLGSYLDS